MGGGGGDGYLKTISKLLAAFFIWGAIIALTVDYTFCDDPEDGGFIAIIVLLWIFTAVGIVGCAAGEWVVMLVFLILYTITFLCYRYYIGAGGNGIDENGDKDASDGRTEYPFIWGTCAAVAGACYMVAEKGGK